MERSPRRQQRQRMVDQLSFVCSRLAGAEGVTRVDHDIRVLKAGVELERQPPFDAPDDERTLGSGGTTRIPEPPPVNWYGVELPGGAPVVGTVFVGTLLDSGCGGGVDAFGVKPLGGAAGGMVLGVVAPELNDGGAAG